MAIEHKPLTNPGVDAVSGKNEGGISNEPTSEDTSNYPHIEAFVGELQHPHELHHALYHAAKKLSDMDGDEKKEEVTMDDYNKLKARD